MKVLLIGIFALLLGIPAPKEGQGVSDKDDAPKLKIHYFHKERRCFTCNSIEKHTKATLDQYFSKELKNGTITFDVTNIDKPENKDIARKFNVYASSLIIEKKTALGYEKLDLTNFAFTNGKNEAKYISEFKKKIDELLN